ncbi:hypothetical protein FB45DRAFT_1061919 [Roridomyces roridus]|uniref:F-box domain-containing protein n=1 Tax=Roridomyces roridus TaxID=1738132 RepID=A0AAD7BJ83_9AGAR|nr:hypothetical protein FB45DRAFT_1061919 [Roridomyces roridus]
MNSGVWNDVQIQGFPRTSPNLTSLFRSWLALSGEHPLTLDVSVELKYSGMNDLQTVLLGCAYRLRSLTASALLSPCVQALLALPDGSMRRLAELCLANSRPSLSPPVHSTVFLESSRLRRVTLIDFYDPAMLNAVEIPWGQLTDLTLRQPVLLMAHLESIPAIDRARTHAELRLPEFRLSELRTRDITFPAVRNLTLYSRTVDNIGRFLRGFTLPLLEELALECERFSPATILPNPFPLLRRFSMAMTPIGRSSPANQASLPWLTAANNAEEVLLPRFYLGITAASRISAGSLLPNLRLLVVHAQDFRTVVPMLQMRLTSQEHSTITELGLNGETRNVTEVEQAAVEDLIKAGVFVCDGDMFKEDRTVHRGQVWSISTYIRFKLAHGTA